MFDENLSVWNIFIYLCTFRLEELLSEESDRKAKLDKWQKIVEETSSLIKDSRSRLDEIKSKDPHTTPEIQEQLDEIQVRYQIEIMPSSVIYCFLSPY